ncbi:MAG: transcriptional repressor [Lachnospiraceae bacterium]|nr:transcriptional repressor [Lachnospiraceae bacterium]
MKSTYKTKSRELITTYLKSHAEQRFTAREIYEEICRQEAGINRTTVYRNLDRLCEIGELLKYKEPNQDAWYYQYSLKHNHCDKHMHGQCSVCGKIFHLDEPFVKSFGDKLLEKYGLDIDPAQTIVLGKCSKCRRIKKK